MDYTPEFVLTSAIAACRLGNERYRILRRVLQVFRRWRGIVDEDTPAGKRYGTSGAKIGNVHLRWAFGEAACLFLRNNPEGQKLHQRLVKKHGKAKALSVLAQKLGRAVYFMLKRQQAFDMNKFFNS